MNAQALPPLQHAGLTPRYLSCQDPRQLLGSNVLAVIGFGADAPQSIGDPRYLRVDLQPLAGERLYEVWTSDQPVRLWQLGSAQGACSETLCFGWINQPEGEGPGQVTIRHAAELAYRTLMQAVSAGEHPHLLRIWNYFDAITEGESDDERYRQFCVGRGEGLNLDIEQLPAATAIGQHAQPRQLQLYWISAREPGIAIENPRQTPAYRYPRC